MRQQDDQCILPEIRGFTAHVRSGDDVQKSYLIIFWDHHQGIRNELLASGKIFFYHGMPSFDDGHMAVFEQFGFDESFLFGQ
jgi:hypothetical protein